MPKVFSFNNVTKYYLLIFAIPIVDNIRAYWFTFLNKITKPSNYDLMNVYELTLISTLVKILMIFLELIRRKLIEKKNYINNQFAKSIVYINEIKKTRNYYNIKNLLIMSVISLCYFLYGASFSFLNDISYMELNFVVSFFFIFSSIVSISLLKYQIFKHHLITLIIICLFIILNFGLYHYNKYSIVRICYMLIIGIFNGLYYTYAKYVIEYKFLSEYIYMFLDGLFNILYLIIFIVVSKYIKCTNSFKSVCDVKTEKYLFSLDKLKYPFKKGLNLITCIAFFIFIFICFVSQLSIINHHSPFHITFANILFIFANFIIYFCLNKKEIDYKFYILLFAYIVVILSILIYIEAIVLHFCDLDKNTKNFIEKRSDTEKIQMLEGLELEEQKNQDNEIINDDHINENDKQDDFIIF